MAGRKRNKVLVSWASINDNLIDLAGLFEEYGLFSDVKMSVASGQRACGEFFGGRHWYSSEAEWQIEKLIVGFRCVSFDRDFVLLLEKFN